MLFKEKQVGEIPLRDRALKRGALRDLRG